MFQAIDRAIGSDADSVTAALMAGLAWEFESGDGAALAQRFIEAEESEFVWQARRSERWLGTYESLDEEDVELDRVAIIGRLGGRWFVAVSIVDGDGKPQGLMERRGFISESEARKAFVAPG